MGTESSCGKNLLRIIVNIIIVVRKVGMGMEGSSNTLRVVIITIVIVIFLIIFVIIVVVKKVARRAWKAVAVPFSESVP
jgi:hypothetical protein